MQFVVSFRFLRGLDLHKLKLNALNPRQLFFYPEWASRTEATPTHLLMSGDPPTPWHLLQPPVRMNTAASKAPDTVIFHSCAWDLPRVNRSGYFYPNDACHPRYAKMRWANETVVGGVLGEHARRARVYGAACMRRGTKLSEETIFGGFGQTLDTALSGLRRSLPIGTRLAVRSCHSGTQVPGDPGGQTAQLRRMDDIVRRTAAAQCVPLLDVWAIDADSGYFKGDEDDFHVPQVGSMQAAVATLLVLIDMPVADVAMKRPTGANATCGTSRAARSHSHGGGVLGVGHPRRTAVGPELALKRSASGLKRISSQAQRSPTRHMQLGGVRAIDR